MTGELYLIFNIFFYSSNHHKLIKKNNLEDAVYINGQIFL
jgi:hypothetical protein